MLNLIKKLFGWRGDKPQLEPKLLEQIEQRAEEVEKRRLAGAALREAIATHGRTVRIWELEAMRDALKSSKKKWTHVQAEIDALKKEQGL